MLNRTPVDLNYDSSLFVSVLSFGKKKKKEKNIKTSTFYLQMGSDGGMLFD